jgi:hypothetical protein
MDKSIPLYAAYHNAGVLKKTTFVTQDQTAEQMQILEFAPEDLEQVGGGLASDQGVLRIKSIGAAKYEIWQG